MNRKKAKAKAEGGRARALRVCAAFALAAGCRAEPSEAVTPTEFVDVMVALRRADLETASPAEYNPRRDSILRAAGVTDSALVDFARRHGRDVAFMAELWDSIALRLSSEDTIVR
jgi:hypothetical protein